MNGSGAVRAFSSGKSDFENSKPRSTGSLRCSTRCRDVEEAEQHEREVAALLASARENHARLVERVNQAFLNCRTISEIEEDLALAEHRLDELTKHREALTLSLQILSNLSREQQEVLAPQLNQNVERRFLRVCHGRYQEVKIDPDFRIWVRESGTGELRNSENLSPGNPGSTLLCPAFRCSGSGFQQR